MQGSIAARITRTANADGRGATVGLARHGTYARKTPRGTQIARWYCPESHTTFSLLPDCLAARLPGEFDTLEAVVAHAEGAASVSAAANALRRDPVGFAWNVPSNALANFCFIPKNNRLIRVCSQSSV